MEIACLLIPNPDSPDGEGRQEAAVRRLEGIGAAVESERPGEVFFAVDGLRGIHGGETAGVLGAARAAVGMEIRIGTGATRFAAFLAANEKPGPLAPFPVAALTDRLDLPEREAAGLVETMERLGIRTLGALAALSSDRVADRFGPPGLRALRLARGEDDPLRPRQPHEELVEEIELPEGTAGHLLDRALELLIDRLLAAPQRRGRTVLGVRIGALLSGGGTWSVDQILSRPSASAGVLRAVLAPRLEALPAPAIRLRLRAVGLGPRAGDQLVLSTAEEEPRQRRLGAAVREVRAVQGGESLLKVLSVDARSRVPERRAMLTPYPEPRTEPGAGR